MTQLRSVKTNPKGKKQPKIQLVAYEPRPILIIRTNVLPPEVKAGAYETVLKEVNGEYHCFFVEEPDRKTVEMEILSPYMMEDTSIEELKLKVNTKFLDDVVEKLIEADKELVARGQAVDNMRVVSTEDQNGTTEIVN